MSSDPKVIAIRADAILQEAASSEKHKFVCATFDEGAFLFKHTAAEIGAILSIKLSFALEKNADPDSGDWYSQMYAPDDAVAALVVKEYTFTAAAAQAYLYSLSIPLMDKAVRVEVSEASTAKGNLAISAVGTSIGQH